VSQYTGCTWVGVDHPYLHKQVGHVARECCCVVGDRPLDKTC
jgi:hypothetical protein